MNQSEYIRRTYGKFNRVMELYSRFLFKKIGHTEDVLCFCTGEHLRVPPKTEDMKPIVPGTVWGGEWQDMWLHTTYTAPKEAQGRILCAIPHANAVEILCYLNGKPNGIINSKNQFIGGAHSVMFLSPSAKEGEEYILDFDCYSGHTCFGTQPLEAYDRDETRNDDPHHTYEGMDFYVLEENIRDFIFDCKTALQLASLPQEDFAAMRAHECVMEAFSYLIQDVRAADIDEIYDSCAKVREILAPCLVKSHGDASRGKIGVIGHSHMDTAWLWPTSETIRKCARTYAEALTLMDMYPEYTFIQSSALHLDWMRRYYPDIFEGIREKVKEGRYEPNGGVWVECDCNITGGESMVRQFLYGQRFTEKYLGYRSDAFWLPDTFGYNAAIPQIMLGSGVKYFYTTKMTWSDLNRFPADTFVWRGNDGSEVLTHLNRMHLIPDVETLYGAVNEIKDKYSCDSRLVAYGYGDGGGGPTFGMLEYLKRVKDLGGMPEIKPTTVSEFARELDERRDKLPVYDGELYLELHRGTLTSMHKIKKNNRLGEIALHDMELFNVLSGEDINEKRDELYEILLKDQFHDILPGSSIPKVYEVAFPEVEGLISDANAETAKYAEKLSSKQPDTVSLYNTLSFERSDALVLDGEFGVEGYEAQVYTDIDGKSKTAFDAKIPAMEALSVKLTSPKASESRFTAECNTLKTPFYTVEFDENGYIASLTDNRADGREIANLNGKAPLGTLWMGENMPNMYDNWEVEDDVFRVLKPVTDMLSREVVSDGAVEYRIRTKYRLSRKSTATIDTVFYSNNPRIDYEASIDWNERHALLKAGFDVNVRSYTFKNEIQFGHMDRPTTRNTTYDCAKFEVCNHKWSDISDNRYGVAILNDCKYGISCEGSDMRLTLLKAGTRPDPFSDVGVHTMVYSLLPHIGGFASESVVQPAYMLNFHPVISSGKLNVPTLFNISAPNIICEAVKSAEDVKNAFVVRLYECERAETKCSVSFPGAKSVTLTNMLEETIETLELTDGNVTLSFRPFEIKTLLIEK